MTSPDKLIFGNSMRRLASPTNEAGLLGIVAEWVDLLADLRFEDAYEFTAHNSDYGWTPELIAQVIKNYGFFEDDGLHNCRVSKPAATKVGDIAPRHQVDWSSEGSRSDHIADIVYDLPLDGVWSDLTATFEAHHFEGRIVLVLNEIHVF